jgi:hypothetical protein
MMVTAVECRRLIDHVEVCFDAMCEVALGAYPTPEDHWAALQAACDRHDQAFRAMHAAVRQFATAGEE